MATRVADRADILPALAEVFREHGFAGASLARIGRRTGLGKGSLYHAFPGGKDEMADLVLREIDGWFAENVFGPLRQGDDPARAIGAMCRATREYFRSGRRVCLVGAFALEATRDRFASGIRAYFADWVDALAAVLVRAGRPQVLARARAEDAIAGIQGALVLARALDDPGLFARGLDRIEARLLAP
ncbi:MAG: TetR/AcrR family transcriptional regulator [Acetobacteraceae bacterium]